MIILDEMQREQLDFRFASFGGRFMAYLIDAILLLLFRWLVALLFGVPFRDTESGILWFGNLFGLLYFILLESGASRSSAISVRFYRHFFYSSVSCLFCSTANDGRYMIS